MPRLSTSLVVTAAAALASSVAAYTPAVTNSSRQQVNATLQSRWRTDSGSGILNDGVTLLANGTDTGSNSTYYGVFVYFNETLAANQTASPVPFVAFVSCDSNPSTQATLETPFLSNGSIATNATVVEGGNSTMSSNATDMTNSTMSGTMNSTDANNSTTTSSVNSTLLPNVFNLAAEMGATSVFLYSETAQSCSLNYSALGDYNHTIPVFASPSSTFTNNLITSQFDNIDEAHRVFNSTLIQSASSNLSSIIASGGTNGIPTSFLLGVITARYLNDSSSGVVATIGRAPSASRTATGTQNTASAAPSQGGTSAGERLSPATAGLTVSLALLAAGAFSLAA
ncbi:hypothetical protein JCM10212_005253 [Sporobolomyces blumeae]